MGYRHRDSIQVGRGERSIREWVSMVDFAARTIVLTTNQLRSLSFITTL